MALYERDKGGQLVPVEGEVPQEAILAIERADEQTIVERLTRFEAQPFFAYSYPIKTKEGIKEVIGIGVDGAKYIASQLGNIKASTDFKIEDRDDYLYCAFPVTDLVRNITLLGVARQSKYIIGEGMIPSDRIDETAFVKVVSKAQRNGILSVADQMMIAQIIARLDTKAIKRLAGPPAPAKLTASKAAPPKAAKPEESTEEKEIKSLRQQLHIKWDELQKLDPSVGEKKSWLKEHYNVESSIELSLEDIREAVSAVDMLIEKTAGPKATTEETRQVAKEALALFTGETEKERQAKVRQLFQETAGKKGGWTRPDLEKIKAKIEELRVQAKPSAETEAEAFLRELEG